MTNKDFAALANHLLPDLPSFVAKSPLMLIPPVNHVLRGLCFEGSDFDKHTFFVWKFFLPLYIPTTHLSFTFGRRIGDAYGSRWNNKTPNLVSELSAAVKQEAIPFLSRIKSPRDVIDATLLLDNQDDPYVLEAFAYSLARTGASDQAVATLDRLVTLLDSDIPWQQTMAERARALKGKLLCDPLRGQQQLEEWESQSLRNLGLEGFS